VKGGVTKMIFALLQLHTDAFLLGDVPIEFFHVTLGLLGSFAFSLSSRLFSFGALTFGLFRLRAVARISLRYF